MTSGKSLKAWYCRSLKYICILMLGFCHILYGQSPQYDPYAVLKTDLVDEYIRDVYQDPEGFIWLLTISKVYRYDGSELEVIHEDDGGYENIFLDKKTQHLIIGGRSVVLEFSLNTGEIDTLFNRSQFSNFQNLLYTAQENDSILWVGTGNGLIRLNRLDKSFRYVELELFDKDYNISSIVKEHDHNNVLWLGTGYGLVKFNTQDYNFEIINFDHLDQEVEEFINRIACLYINQDEIYCGTRLGAVKYNIKDKTHKIYKVGYSKDKSTNNYTGFVNKIFSYKGLLWLSSAHGAMAINLSSGKIEFEVKSKNPFDQIDIGPMCIDTDGRFWVGYKNGVRIIDPHLKQFQSQVCPLMNESRHLYIPRSAISFPNDPRSFIAVDFSNGVYAYNPTNKTWALVANKNSNQDRYWDIRLKGNTAFVLGEKNIFSFRRNDKTLTDLDFDFNNQSLFRRFAIDDSHNFWISSNTGLHIGSFDNQEIYPYKNHSFQLPEFLDQAWNQVQCDSKGKIWVGCEDKIVIIDNKNERYQVLPLKNKLGQGCVIRNFYEHNQQMWIYTNYGILCIPINDPNKEDLKTVHLQNCYSNFHDKNDNIWATHKYELLKLNKENNQMDHYSLENLIPNSKFLGLDIITPLSTGNILIGGRGNFVEFSPEALRLQDEVPEPYFKSIEINGSPIKFNQKVQEQIFEFKQKENNIDFSFSSIKFSQTEGINYAYRLLGAEQDNWRKVNYKQKNISYANLKGGDYTFQLKASNHLDQWSDPIEFLFCIKTSIFEKLWFQVLMTVLGLSLAYLVYHWRIQNIKEKNEIDQKIIQLENRALRAQMNPHFVFNSMNSIQHLISAGQYKKSMLYLNKFGKLLRAVLESSKSNRIQLDQEIRMLENYLALEELRFDGDFKWKIKVDQSLINEFIEIPGMLIQPLIENAIHHGLITKDGPGFLKLEIKDLEEWILITVEDNGIGREASKALNIKKRAQHISNGLDILNERLELSSKEHFKPIKIIDLKDENNEAQGTRVEIQLKI